MNDGSAQRASKLVAFEQVAAGVEEVACVQRPIAEVVECGAVKLVGAGLGYDVDSSSGPRPYWAL